MATGPFIQNSNVCVKVTKGDTLSGIASKYTGKTHTIDGKNYTIPKMTYNQLGTLNNIKNVNLIYVNQIIKLSGSASSSGSGSSTKKANTDKVDITAFGPSASNDRQLIAAWDNQPKNTENYEVEWLYYAGDRNNAGKAIWLKGSGSGTTEEKYSTYDIPDDAKQVKFRVKPISKDKSNKNGKTSKYFEGKWSTYKEYKNIPPLEVDAPEVKIEGLTLTAELDNVNASDLNATHVEFQLVKNNKTIVGDIKRAAINKTSNYVSCSWTVEVGSEYKVRCRSYRDGVVSDWSNFSNAEQTKPAKPTIKTCKANKKSTDNSITVYLEWSKANTAKTYTIQYTTVEEYFDNSSGSVESVTTTDDKTFWEIPELEKGYTYFFRVCANNDSDDASSDWSDHVSLVVGEPPAAPTTWSSTTTATVGGPLTLYWVHNAKDGSSETYAEVWIEVYQNDTLIETIDQIVRKSTDADEKDKTSFYVVDTTTASFREGVQLRWRVRTAGISNEFSDESWSIIRTIDIYAQPTLNLTVTPYGDVGYTGGSTIEALTSFPITVNALPGPATQTPIGYYLSITSNEIYETVDEVGNDKFVNSGDKVYSEYFDINTTLEKVISASDVNLDNGVNYTLTCLVAMDSGLTAEASINFTVAWTDGSYTPNAEITFDPETLVTHIHPYCYNYTSTFYKVIKSNRKYTLTDEVVDIAMGDPLSNTYTTTGEQVYSGMTAIEVFEDGTMTGGEEIYYHEIQTGTPIEGISLSVYRREFDGSFTELATGVDNTKNTFVTDPHPALDYARYRIVAVEDSTGGISYNDLPGHLIGEKAVIIQWDEEWSTFDVIADDPQEQPPWSGSLLRLPYNIDVSDSYNPDTEFIEYAGRSHPVSYYGTQLGESASWSVEIEKDDKETIFALRRLARWQGDVYVREPSGTGYWANIGVSFGLKHKDLTVPVTLAIKRVEGGA